MDEKERLRREELINIEKPEIQKSFFHASHLVARLRTMTLDDPDYRSVIEELIPGFPKSSTLIPPVNCDHGDGIRVGENTYINYNCTFLDGGYITIGNNVLIGPGCSFFTPQHPFDYLERRKPIETSHPITIGDDTWLGGNVTVVPGVKIGCRCIIGAGSVVTKDIPDDSVAVGNPAHVIRKLNGAV